MATAPGVVACNMANVPLLDASVDVAIFCLALMGTDYGAFLQVDNTTSSRVVQVATPWISRERHAATNCPYWCRDTSVRWRCCNIGSYYAVIA